MFVSGVFLVAVSSAVYGSGEAGLSMIMALAFLGALAGDHAGYYVGYYIGHRVGPAFHHLAFAEKYRDPITRAERLIRKYGVLAIFIGRFIPAIRSLIPALLGISGFKALRYSLCDATACLLWSLGLGLIVIGVDSFL